MNAPVETIESSREAWSALAPATRNVFSTWEWAATWWRHFGRRGRIASPVVVADGGVPLAVLPVYRRSLGPVTVVRFIGHGPADELGPVCATGDRDAALARLEAVLGSGRESVFLGDRLSGGWPEHAVPVRPVTRAPSPVLRFRSRSWEEYLASRSRNFRQTLRRKERRILELGGAFRLSDSAHVEADLDRLFELHRERWGGRRTGFVSHEAFHRDFARVAMVRGWLRLWLLEVDGEAAAAWLGFRYEGVESYYQAGRAGRYEQLSPGLVLLAHSVRRAQADGMGEYRFLRGDEPFKRRFTDDASSVVTVVAARGTAARAALAAALAARRAPLAWRRLRSSRRDGERDGVSPVAGEP